MARAIQKQVKLPFKVAFDVVMQGIRIRFGRSLVTVTGVVLGIAFLMSILAGQVLRQGVSEEDGRRADVDRMMNFLRAEVGPVTGRSFGVLVLEPLAETERRLLLRLVREGATAFNIVGPLPDDLLQRLQSAKLETVDLAQIASGASAVIVFGHPERLSSEPDWSTILAEARQRVVAFSRASVISSAKGDISVINLSREPRPEELERAAEDERRERFRNNWIVIISLLVTIIGISNAMLMSVTERFREIGTMKCLGALSSFVRQMFLIESALMGTVGGIVGSLVGALFSIAAYGITYGFGIVWIAVRDGLGLLLLYALVALIIGILLSVIAAIYPAWVASRMVPATALRSNV